MEYHHLLELIQTVSATNISGFQYEEGDTRIVITTGGNGLPGCVAATEGSTVKATTTAAVTTEASAAVQSVVSVQTVSEQKQPVGNIVNSPLVGTFYTAPAEDADPFVQVGDSVKKGQTLAIVEAMKLMNDIEAEYEGKILEIFVENGATVEYGQPLFAIG